MDYDIEALKLIVNRNFNFVKNLENQLQLSPKDKAIDFSLLSEFGSNMMKDASKFVSGLENPKEVKKMDAFVKKLF